MSDCVNVRYKSTVIFFVTVRIVKNFIDVCEVFYFPFYEKCANFYNFIAHKTEVYQLVIRKFPFTFFTHLSFVADTYRSHNK